MPEWSKGADLRPAVYNAWVQTPLDAIKLHARLFKYYFFSNLVLWYCVEKNEMLTFCRCMPFLLLIMRLNSYSHKPRKSSVLTKYFTNIKLECMVLMLYSVSILFMYYYYFQSTHAVVSLIHKSKMVSLMRDSTTIAYGILDMTECINFNNNYQDDDLMYMRVLNYLTIPQSDAFYADNIIHLKNCLQNTFILDKFIGETISRNIISSSSPEDEITQDQDKTKTSTEVAVQESYATSIGPVLLEQNLIQVFNNDQDKDKDTSKEHQSFVQETNMRLIDGLSDKFIYIYKDHTINKKSQILYYLDELASETSPDPLIELLFTKDDQELIKETIMKKDVPLDSDPKVYVKDSQSVPNQNKNIQFIYDITKIASTYMKTLAVNTYKQKSITPLLDMLNETRGKITKYRRLIEDTSKTFSRNMEDITYEMITIFEKIKSTTQFALLLVSCQTHLICWLFVFINKVSRSNKDRNFFSIKN